MHLVALVWALAALSPNTSLGVPTAAPQPIIGGDPVDLSQWPSVVAIIGLDEGLGSSTVNLCTGVLLDKQTALTAAHCLDEADSFDQILVIFGDTIYTTDENRRTTATQYGVHPDYCLGEEGCDQDVFDFGYVVLDQPVMGIDPIPPLVDQEEWDELMTVDHEVLLVGFGATRDVETDDEDEPPTPLSMDEVGGKRSVTTVVSGLSDAGLELYAGDEGRDTCFGDSGGPVFAQLASGEWRLVGITSRGVSPCGTGRGIYGVPYAALPWIRDETSIDLLPEDCPQAQCLETAPEVDEGGCCSIADREERGPGWLAGLSMVLFVTAVGRRRA